MEPKNNLDEVREILMETMRDLKAGKIDLDKAGGIQALGQTLINSAKVEVDFLKATGSQNETGFIAEKGRKPGIGNGGGVQRIGRS